MPLIKISSFHSKVCPSVLLSKIHSFLFWGLAVCTSQISTPSVCTSYISTPSFCTSHISTPSFLGFDCMLPLCTTCSAYYPLGWDVLGQEGQEVPGHYTYWAASVALDPSPRGWARVWGCSYLGRDDPGQFPLARPGCTRPYTNTSPPRLVVNKVHKRL